MLLSAKICQIVFDIFFDQYNFIFFKKGPQFSVLELARALYNL